MRSRLSRFSSGAFGRNLAGVWLWFELTESVNEGLDIDSLLRQDRGVQVEISDQRLRS